MEILVESRAMEQKDSFAYSNVVFLAGSARSGTTWLANIINYKNDYRYIFEPFWPESVPECRPITAYQYLRPDCDDMQYVSPAKTIVSGDFRNPWTDQFNANFETPYRLIKGIRANLLLRWLYSHFPGISVIFLLRHPCAVVNSRMQLGWGPYLGRLIAQQPLVEDFLASFMPRILDIGDEFEKQIASWCIENLVPLRQFKKAEAHVVFYEYCCLTPRKEIERLFCFLGKQPEASIVEQISRPAEFSREESAINRGENLIAGWRHSVTASQMRKAMDILKMFGLDSIYGADLTPRIPPSLPQNCLD